MMFAGERMGDALSRWTVCRLFLAGVLLAGCWGDDEDAQAPPAPPALPRTAAAPAAPEAAAAADEILTPSAPTAARKRLPRARDLPLLNCYSYLDDILPGSPAGDLAARIDKELARSEPGARRRNLATLRVRLDDVAYNRADPQEIPAEVAADLARQLGLILRGENVFGASEGLRGYYAQNDSSAQPYDVTLPERYDAGGRHPLVVFLHHHGWTDWHRPFQCYAPSVEGAVAVAPHGRGSCDYMWIAEDDVLSVIDCMLADFAVDPDRVYVTGWSMGGTGSFHLPARYPHRFAAAWPVAGNADFTAWEEEWKADRRRMETPRAGTRLFLRWRTAPVTWVENYLNLAMSCDHGRYDTINPVGHSKSVAGRMRQLGYEGRRFRFGEGGHGWGASLTERCEWMARFTRDPAPKRVRLKTDSYRHGRAYWAEITRLTSRMKNADLDVEVVSPTEIRINRAENVERFAVHGAGPGLAETGVTVTWTENEAPRSFKPPNAANLHLYRTEGGWGELRLVGEKREGYPPRKARSLEGPINDVYRDPFMIVVGTTAKDGFFRRVIREEAGRMARIWRARFQCWPPVKDDAEVTDADIASRSLVLFGGPGENSITARVAGKLPVTFGEGSISLGGKTHVGEGLGVKLCYPNPLAPDRMIVLQAATSPEGMWQTVHRFGNWFDWMPLSNLEWYDYCVYDSKTRGFETMLDVGFFDEDWRVSDELRWGPVAGWRERSLARNLPRHRTVPAGETVRLSDLWPESIDTLRGPVRVDRSLHGKDLCIGRARQSFGIGVWIESAVTWRLDGQFARFSADCGIDAEGQREISDARAATESTTFEILGDGKVLGMVRGVRFGDGPSRFEVDVAGVRRLTLRALRSSPKGWLYGPVAWGSPTLVRGKAAAQAPRAPNDPAAGAFPPESGR